jgi:hypothetical protein
MYRTALRTLFLFVVVACSGGDSGSPTPGDGEQQNNNPPDETGTKNPDLNKPSRTPNPGNGTPGSEKAPAEIDPVAAWKTYRASFQALAVNGAKPCADERPCLSFGRRTTDPWYDGNKVVPQIMGWTFVLSRSGSVTQSMEIPIFTDRGEVGEKDGVLIYRFSGVLYREGMGSGNVEFRLDLEPQADGTIKIAALAKNAYQEISRTFLLKEIPNTKLADMPDGIRKGLIAIKEDIQKTDERSQGLVCEISATPGSRYLLSARYYLHKNGELLPSRGIFTDLHYGIFEYVLSAQGSTATVTPREGDGTTWYYTTYDMKTADPKEIPVYGVGGKHVKTDYKDVENFKAAVDKICADIMRSQS